MTDSATADAPLTREKLEAEVARLRGALEQVGQDVKYASLRATREQLEAARSRIEHLELQLRIEIDNAQRAEAALLAERAARQQLVDAVNDVDTFLQFVQWTDLTTERNAAKVVQTLKLALAALEPNQTHEPCMCCPVEVRGLFAVAFNLLNLRKDPDRWQRKIGERLDELQLAVDKLQPFIDAHFKNQAIPPSSEPRP